MSSEEKKKILQMIEDGKISPEDAVTLIKALEENPVDDEAEYTETEVIPGSTYDAHEFEEVKARARKYASIPLGVGVVLTVLAAYWMFVLTQNANYGFWFFCAWFPLLLGLLLVALSAGGFNSRWLYVDVRQEPGEWPERITFGFPIPFGIANWGLRNFGHYASNLDREKIDSLISILDASQSISEPLIVNVDEGEGGEQVQVYIG
jgi:hypothetical protein